MRVEMVKIGSIKPYPGNAKKHPKEQIERIANSIREFGFQQPLVVDSQGVIIIGHGRLRAAKKLGLDSVPVVRAEGLSEDQIRALRLADNKTAESEWDLDLLDLELEGIDLDMSQFGFDLNLEEDETEVSEVDVPSEVESRVEAGDVWLLGRHKLICGDSTDVTVIDRLMGGQKPDLVLTDPPYGVKAVNDSGTVIGYGEKHLAKRGVYKEIIGDNTTETAQAAYDVLQGICDRLIIFGGNYFLSFLPQSDGWVIWDKRGAEGEHMRNNFADGEMAWCSFHTPVRIYHQLWNGMIRQGEHDKRVHPTQKPVKMLSEIVSDFSQAGDVVLDVFGGSGSVLMACEQTGRQCLMCELDPYYCDVIIARWETLTGNKAIKEV